MRLFIAAELPENIREYVQRLQKHVECQKVIRGSFTPHSQVHITLKFIGDIPEEHLTDIKQILTTIKYPQQKARLGSLDVFTQGTHIRIVMITIVCPGLAVLIKKLDELLLPWCIPEKRMFVGHVTLARVKHVENRQKLLHFIQNYTIEPHEFILNSFVLKKSKRTSVGAVHTDIARYQLV